MSNATFESPVAASQLFFAWSEQAEVGVAPAAPVRKKSAPRRTPATTPQTPTAPAVAPNLPQAAPTESAALPVVSASEPAELISSPSGHLTFTSDGRIAKPVRIGSVMIKLLKRYGITDAEIAEGVANYAQAPTRAGFLIVRQAPA